MQANEERVPLLPKYLLPQVKGWGCGSMNPVNRILFDERLTMTSTFTVASVQVGKRRTLNLGRRQVSTGIHKRPSERPFM